MGRDSKRRYIKVDAAFSYLKERFLGRERRTSAQRRAEWGEGCVRTLNTLKFLCLCSVSLIQVLTPWALCVSETLSVLLIYFLATTRPLLVHEAPAHYHFSYTHSLEDVVGLSCTRSALLSLAYATGMQHMHRPYLYASYLLAALCFPYLVVKMVLFRYTQDAVPAAAIFIITSLFCWLHVFAARRTVEWARRRYQLGLAGSHGGYAWALDGDDRDASSDGGGDGGGGGGGTARGGGWGVLGGGHRRAHHYSDVEEMSRSGDGFRGSDDVPAETLADDDSKFLQVAGVKVHYKEVVPPSVAGSQDPEAQQLAIVLVHGFGAGVFAWRHVMEPLAYQCQCRVLAFDRPAFGLTSRPSLAAGHQPNPYTLGAQAHLMLSLCQALGLTRVVIAAHADGCLLALRAASMSIRSLQGIAGLRSAYDSPEHHHHHHHAPEPYAKPYPQTARPQHGDAAAAADRELLMAANPALGFGSGRAGPVSSARAARDASPANRPSTASAAPFNHFQLPPIATSHGSKQQHQQQQTTPPSSMQGSPSLEPIELQPPAAAATLADPNSGNGRARGPPRGSSAGGGGGGAADAPSGGLQGVGVGGRGGGGSSSSASVSSSGNGSVVVHSVEPTLHGGLLLQGSGDSGPDAAFATATAAAGGRSFGGGGAQWVAPGAVSIPMRSSQGLGLSGGLAAAPLHQREASASGKQQPAAAAVGSHASNGNGLSASVITQGLSFASRATPPDTLPGSWLSSHAGSQGLIAASNHHNHQPSSPWQLDNHHHHPAPSSSNANTTPTAATAGTPKSTTDGGGGGGLPPPHPGASLHLQHAAPAPAHATRSSGGGGHPNATLALPQAPHHHAAHVVYGYPAHPAESSSNGGGGGGGCYGGGSSSSSVSSSSGRGAQHLGPDAGLAAGEAAPLLGGGAREERGAAAAGGGGGGGPAAPVLYEALMRAGGAVAGAAAAAAAAAGGGVGMRAEGARHRRAQSTPGPVGGVGPDGRPVAAAQAPGQGLLSVSACPSTPGGGSSGMQGPWPQVLGLALLHPNLSGTQGPALSRLLASSRLGRSILRALLRSELGEVANRRAWHNSHKLTAEVLELYKAPLRVEGWCESLIETTRLRRDQAQGDLPAYLHDARHLPALLLTGEHDRLVPPSKVELLSTDLPHARVGVVPGCGHLAHEESPGPLLQQLAPFCEDVLLMARQNPHQQPPAATSAAASGHPSLTLGSAGNSGGGEAAAAGVGWAAGAAGQEVVMEVLGPAAGAGRVVVVGGGGAGASLV